MLGVRTLLIPALAAIALCSCTSKPATTQDALDRKFEEMMKSATLVGRSSSLTSGKVGGEERYVIDGVSKLAGDT